MTLRRPPLEGSGRGPGRDGSSWEGQAPTRRSSREGHTPPTRRSSQEGHTLFELVLVLAILGIVAAMVLPRAPGRSSRQLLEREAQAVYGILVEARSRAIAQQAEARFRVQGGSVYSLEVREADHWSVTRRGSLDPESGAVTIDGSGTGSIHFYAHAQVDAPRTVEVRYDRATRRLEVLPNGLVRWIERNP